MSEKSSDSGSGVSCSGCTKSIPLIDSVGAHQKQDARLARIRQCSLKKGRDFALQIKHDDLIHACNKFTPLPAINLSDFLRPLPSPVVRQYFEQEAQTPGNDFMAACAAANLYATSVSGKKKTIDECRLAIDAIKKRDPLSGSMISGLFENAIAAKYHRNESASRSPVDLSLAPLSTPATPKFGSYRR